MNKAKLTTIKATLMLAVSGAIMTGCTATDIAETVETSLSNTESVNYNVMAYARFVPERNDDFAWENDKVAFRVYGPAAPLQGHSSGVDAWFKSVDYTIIDKWYEGHLNGISYHEDHGEGYDPYHTGISRGVGATVIWVEGEAYAAHSYKSYRINKGGGDEVSFTLHYAWDTPLGAVEEMKTISLPLGTQLFNVDSVFTLNGEPAALPIAIGVATHDEKAEAFYNRETGRISTWETIDNYGVGTGALLAADKVEDIKHIPSDVKDESHIWMFTSSNDDGTLSYKAGFAWEGAGEITTNNQWQRYLDGL